MRRVGKLSAMAAFGLALVLPVSASVAAEPPTPWRQLCNPDKIKQTNAWVDCLQRTLDEHEAELEGIVGKIATAMIKADMLEEPKRSENRALFEATQENWLRLRDDDCKAYGAHEAGLGFGALQFRLMCLLDETVLRVRALKIRHREELK